ncbi:unnamed protein product, partial [Rotaria sordida]
MLNVKKSDVDSNQSEVEQQTELMYKDNTIWTAVFNADKTAINNLVDIDQDIIHTRGAVGECPIHMLFLYGSDAHLEIARDLIIRFPFIVTQIYNKPVYYGENILHIAIVKRYTTMVEWLLCNEHLESYRQQLLTATATGDFFKIGQPSYYGETPLGFACCTNQWDMVEILLKYGADMDATDSNGNTILHMLVICNLPEIYAKFKARWIEQQVSNDNDKTSGSISTKQTKLWNRLNKDGFTPLTLAADISQSKMLSWLLYERKKIQWSYGNVSCILHPLDQLDRDFHDDNKQQPLSVIEIMIKNNDPELVHPIIISLIDKKWKYFAYRILIHRFLITFLYLLVFLGTTILQQTRSETTSRKKDKKTASIHGTDSNVSRQITCAVGRFILIFGALWKSKREINEMRSLGLKGYISSIKQCFLGLLGDFDIDHYAGGQYPKASITLFIFYVVVITILLLNLLIAMMGDTYADVKKSAKKLWHLERARIALYLESGIAKSERHLTNNKYWIDVQGKRYLQVEQ